jgi:hypothetical protein
MQRIITPTDQQEYSILWAIGLALDDQEHYLKTGNPAVDYADEWPEVAATKAEQLNILAHLLQLATQAGRNLLIPHKAMPANAKS